MTAETVNLAPPIRPGRSMQRLLVCASGLMVTFFAFGFASWFSGAACWVSFYLGARGQQLIMLARITTTAGFVFGIVIPVVWYWRRCRGGRADVPPRAALLACLTLPFGSIFWAIFVDAIAWHYRQDIVRPAFDFAIMYLVLGAVLPLTLAVPCIVLGLQRRAMSVGLSRMA
jgi:hypothetical protein